MNESDPPIERDLDLQLIEALGVVDRPTTATSDRHLSDLRTTVATTQDQGLPTVVRSLRRRPGRIATGVIGIAAALLVVAAIDARPTSSNRADATTLERLATKAGDTPPVDPERPVLHITYRISTNDDGGDGPEDPESRPPERIEAWRRSDGSGLERNTLLRPGGGRQEIPGSDPEGSMYAWDEAHRSCTLRRAGDAGVLRTLQGRRFDTDLLASLPTDPDQLRSSLERILTTKAASSDAKPSEDPAPSPSKESRDRAGRCESTAPESTYSDDEVTMYVDEAVMNLLGPWSTPDLRAAAFDLLADRSDVRVGKGPDPLGRDAVTIASVLQGNRFTIYIDPATTEYLGTVGHDAAGNRISEELVERSEWVAEVPTA